MEAAFLGIGLAAGGAFALVILRDGLSAAIATSTTVLQIGVAVTIAISANHAVLRPGFARRDRDGYKFPWLPRLDLNMLHCAPLVLRVIR